jgi:hypothetical protein
MIFPAPLLATSEVYRRRCAHLTKPLGFRFSESIPPVLPRIAEGIEPPIYVLAPTSRAPRHARRYDSVRDSFEPPKFAITIVANFLVRAQLKDAIAGITAEEVVSDITSSGHGASRWRSYGFKNRTCRLDSIGPTSTVVAFPSPSYATDVQTALVNKAVRRFALFLSPDAPSIIDATLDPLFEVVEIRRPFCPELRGSVKATAYSTPVRILLYNFGVGTPFSYTDNGMDFVTSLPQPLPPSVCRSFNLKGVQAEANVHRRHLLERDRQFNATRIKRLARLASLSTVGALPATSSVKAVTQPSAVTDAATAISLLLQLDEHLDATGLLPTTTTASMTACARHLAVCHDEKLASALFHVAAIVTSRGSQRQQAAAIQGLRHVFDTNRTLSSQIVSTCLVSLLASTDDDKELRRRCRGLLSHLIAAEPARSKATINVQVNAALLADAKHGPNIRRILDFWSTHTHSHAGALVDQDTWADILRGINVPNDYPQSTSLNYEVWEDPPSPWLPAAAAGASRPTTCATWNVNGLRSRWRSGYL